MRNEDGVKTDENAPAGENGAEGENGEGAEGAEGAENGAGRAPSRSQRAIFGYGVPIGLALPALIPTAFQFWHPEVLEHVEHFTGGLRGTVGETVVWRLTDPTVAERVVACLPWFAISVLTIIIALLSVKVTMADVRGKLFSWGDQSKVNRLMKFAALSMVSAYLMPVFASVALGNMLGMRHVDLQPWSSQMVGILMMNLLWVFTMQRRGRRLEQELEGAV